MKYFILFTIILKVTIFSCSLSHAQNKSYKLLSRIEIDSAKLYYFNCDSNSKIEQNGLLNDISLVDVNQNWAYTLSQVSYKLSEIEIKDILHILKNSVKDLTDSDPSACYVPRMGIAFFKGKVAVAHIDVCLECDKMACEIFTEKLTIQLREPPSTIGPKTIEFFESLCLRYNLKRCKVD